MRTAFLLSVSALLVALHLHDPIGVAADDAAVSDDAAAPVPVPYSNYDDEDEDEDWDEEEYELQIREAMQRHAASSKQLLQRALKEGGASAAVEVEVGADGSVDGTGSESNADAEELWQAEFALQALQRELNIIADIKRELHLDEYGSEDDYYSGDDDYYSGDDEDYSGDGGSGDDDYDSGDNDGAYYNSGDNYVNYMEHIKDESLKALLEGITDAEHRREVFEDIMEEADTKSGLDPEEWFTFSYWTMHAYFSCARVFAGPRPVYDKEKWDDLRQYYQEEREGAIGDGDKTRSYQFSDEHFDPPLEPFQSGEKGRGLKAARDISKGELVFKATNNTIIFTEGENWRNFLFAINERNGEPYDDATTCDVLVWSWVQTLEDKGPLVIVADLDNGSLLNEGRDEHGWDKPNVRCGEEGDKRCMMSYYATSDIKKGEELLCDYREFAMLDSWGSMGL